MRQVSQPVKRLQRLLPAHLHLIYGGDGCYHLYCWACGRITLFTQRLRPETILAAARTHTCPEALDLRSVLLVQCPQCLTIQPEDVANHCAFGGYHALQAVPDLPDPLDVRD